MLAAGREMKTGTPTDGLPNQYIVFRDPPPPNRRPQCEGGRERHLTEAAVMVAIGMYLLEKGAMTVALYPDGMHGKRCDISGSLEANGFSLVSAHGTTSYGGTYQRGHQTASVTLKPGLGDVVADVGKRHLVAECKGGHREHLPPQPTFQTPTRIVRSRGLPMARPANGERHVAAVQRERLGGTEESMRRTLISTVLCTACLLLGVSVTFAKKKAEKPVQERFEATMSPAFSSDNSVTVAIEEFSTDEEVQDLAQAFARGGADSLEKALGKIKKGYFGMAGGQTMPLLIVQSSAEGGVRRLNILGQAPTLFGGAGDVQVSIGHRGYPYTCIQLEVDEKGKGTGLLVPYANVVFNQQGRIVIKPMSRAATRLVNVHLEK